jgi:hypothetical protein
MPTTEDGHYIDQKDIDTFVMPRLLSGQTIRWWGDGTTHRPPTIAIVVAVGRRSIQLRTASGMVKNEARHIDDPKIRMNEEQRRDGAWDYTDEYLENQRIMGSILNRLDALETDMAKTKVAVATRQVQGEDGDEPAKERKPSGFAQRAALVQEAKALGCKMEKNMTMDEIKDLMGTVRMAKAIKEPETQIVGG